MTEQILKDYANLMSLGDIAKKYDKTIHEIVNIIYNAKVQNKKDIL